MTALGFTGWDDLGAKAGSWRIEKEQVRPQTAAFFPDQNGGVYERLISALPVALHCMDASGRLISANRQWCESFGYALHEVLGRSFSEFLPPESRSKLVTTIYPKYLATNTCRAEEILFIRKDGSLATVLLSMTAYRGDKGRLDPLGLHDRGRDGKEDRCHGFITQRPALPCRLRRFGAWHGGDLAYGPD